MPKPPAVGFELFKAKKEQMTGLRGKKFPSAYENSGLTCSDIFWGGQSIDGALKTWRLKPRPGTKSSGGVSKYSI